MREDIELTRVLGAIYNAALDPELWTDALAGVAAFVGGPVGALGAEDEVGKLQVGKLIDLDDRAGVDLQYRQRHAKARGKRGSLAAVPPLDAGDVATLAAVMPRDDDCSAPLHREGARPRSRGDVVGTVPEKPEPRCTSLGVVRSEANDIADNDVADNDIANNDVANNDIANNDLGDDGPAEHEMRRRVALIAPHMRRAILIGEAIDQKAREATIFAGILDSLRAGLFLIDPNGQIVHANAAGRGILAANDVLRSIGGRLVARDAAFNRALRDIFAGRCEAAIGGHGLALPLTARDGECHVAHILPLGEAARDLVGVASKVVAAVFVCEAALEISSCAEVIQRAYQLTPTELRVLLAIVNVGGIPQVAAALGVAVSTIKTHVGRLYDKTGAVRQADLVKLVVGFLNPLVA